MIEDESKYNASNAMEWARMGHRSLASDILQSWDNPHETDQAIAEWKNGFKQVGLDFDDVQTVWCCAVVIERAYALVMANFSCEAETEEGDEIEHFLDHLNYGLTPLVLTIDSAIRNLDDADAMPIP